MNYNEVVSLIGNVTDPKREWIKRNVGSAFGPGASANILWVYAKDTNLCIHVDLQDDSFLAPGGVNRYYRVHYGSELLDSVIFAPADQWQDNHVVGGPDATGCTHAQLPLPESGTTVSRYRYGIARIVNESEPNLDFAMATAGFTVAA
jgi:hypothetical protein